ncbi:hypothetical protein AMAG_20254 [Allomyces macrogynus ATCC 38327]|uniref:Uncharacterized protein n=1 Tax=Allomyces macrogynus (strain ATCC 38327) TaxID=578462 RepID=A0A0L0T687_ALLM3|nr:hypothetical protein AMAG_20254 [Allomyces macrogynus ATCC 38327]|eukprot:KNE70201.1 hypothetical protein AMAG_20254 [Allomyces macrogynus ATCC 38327]
MLASMAPTSTETSAPALVVDSAAQGRGTTWAAVVASGSPIRAPTPARPAGPVLDDTDLFPALLPTSSTDSLGLTSHDAEIDLRTSLTATTLATSASGLATPIPQANTARPATPTPASSAGGKGVGPVLLGETKAALMLDGNTAATAAIATHDNEVAQTPIAPMMVSPVSQANPEMHERDTDLAPRTSSALGLRPTIPTNPTAETTEPFIALASRTIPAAIAAVVTPTPTPAPPGDHLADSYVWVASTPTSNSPGMTTTSPGSPATECWAVVPRPTRSGKSSPTAMGLSGEAVRRSMLLSPSPRATAKVPVGHGVGESGVLRHFAPPYVPVGARSPTRVLGEGDGGERRADRMLP